jgi:hypothetical protein
MMTGHINQVNRDLAAEPMMAGAQIKRFLVLHKELDADDGELTRTQKVRRSFLAERYGPLIEALYDGSSEKYIETEMTFEDGRKGVIRATVKVARCGSAAAVERNAGGSRMNARIQHVELHAEDDGLTQAGDVMLKVDNVSLSFGGVKAISDISFDIRKGEIRAIIGPNGAGKTSMLNVINGFYHPQEGVITFRGKARSRMQPYEAAASGIARTFQNVALFKGMSTLDNIMSGRTLKMHKNFFWQVLNVGPARDEEIEHRLKGRGDHRFPRDPAHPQDPGGQAALRPAEEGRTRPRAGDGAGSAAARRADGGHESRGKGGHEPLHPRCEQPDGYDHRADRARHGRGHGHLRPGGGARLRAQDR